MKHKKIGSQMSASAMMMLSESKYQKLDKFAVKFYNEEEGVIIKGNGFDGLRVGETREEAEEFIGFINTIIEMWLYTPSKEQ